MSPEAARRSATEQFGDVTRVRETCTSMLAADRSAEARRTFVSISWLDVKLGLRMFAKYPALSIVAVLGMSVAVAIGAGYFGFIGALLDTTLPFEEGHRVVMIQKRYIAGPDIGDTDRASEHDFVHWRGALKSVEDLSAFRDESYNLIRDAVTAAAGAGRRDDGIGVPVDPRRARARACASRRRRASRCATRPGHRPFRLAASFQR